jgi:RNA polymerase sigma-70 factor, ECF subfamily
MSRRDDASILVMPDRDELAGAFLAALADPAVDGAKAITDLDARLAEKLAAGQARWPGIDVAGPRFVGFLAERLPSHLPCGEGLAGLHAEDLYLTCACTDGVAGAVEQFEAAHRTAIDVALAGIDGGHALGDEVRQRVRAKLFLREGGAAPRIASYSGRGDLRSWVRATTIREAITILRAQGKEVLGHDEMIAAMPADADDPELAHLKQLYRAEFKAAFEHAFGALEAKDRLLLRYRFVDGANIDDIAAIYRVHRATAARWIADVRERLFTETRRRMTESLDVSPSEVDSIVRMIRSQLEASISGQLRDQSS